MTLFWRSCKAEMDKQSKAPFREGDLLCLTGGGVLHGRYVHIANEPILNVHGNWCNGARKWGTDGGVSLRHATLADVIAELNATLRGVKPLMARLETLAAYAKTLQARRGIDD
jgi:hypothetical protein